MSKRIWTLSEYIALDNPNRAVTFREEIRAEIRTISRNPLLYRLRPEIGSDVRMGIVGQYAILFQVSECGVTVERIVYAGRDLPALLGGEE